MAFNSISLEEVHHSVPISSYKNKWNRLFAFFGPAYLVSVGYMDPGNWATDLQGGAQFGYRLIWILLVSNLIAVLLQNLSARLGIVQRVDLAQASRLYYPSWLNGCLYILAELAIAACDLAEVLGMALGLYLLLGLPLFWGIAITILDTFIILWLQKWGIRTLEVIIISLIFIIGFSFVIELFLAKPNWTHVGYGFIPTSLNSGALYIAIGIVGATVMPHNLYLHSALVQSRKIQKDNKSILQAIKYNKIDTGIALNLAFFVNAAILILAASVFFTRGHQEVASIKDAHKLLAPLIGSRIAPIIFAIALIASGQSSTITGTLAGQVVMEGYIQLRLNPWIRRLITRLLAVIPALLVVELMGENKIDALLVLSQVILSLQLSFAVVPLIHFVSKKKRMGQFAISLPVKCIAWVVAFLLAYLNFKLVFEQSMIWMHQDIFLIWKLLIVFFSIFFAVLLFITFLFPIIQKDKKDKVVPYPHVDHSKEQLLKDSINDVLLPKKIAIAVDLGKNTQELIMKAISRGNKETEFVLIHVVESASTFYLQDQVDDNESREDIKQLDQYVAQITELGFKAMSVLGYAKREKEIIRITQEYQVDLLIMAASKHNKWKDYILGDTIDNLRHQLSIPILTFSFG